VLSNILLTPFDREIDTEGEAHVPGIARCAASRTFRRPLSTVRAVCVNAPVRICAGAISDGRPYRDSNSIPSCLPVIQAQSRNRPLTGRQRRRFFMPTLYPGGSSPS